LSSPEAADEIIALFRQVAVLLSSEGNDLSNQQNVQVPVNVKLWRVPGCHELLASLGFDLTEVGKEDVTLRMGKTAYKRQIQFALQALLALFDTQEAPRSLDVDEEDSDVMDGDNSPDFEDNDGVESFLKEVHSGFPTPKRFGLRNPGNDYSSAFTCYVRKRGEPDGRQAGNGDSPTQPSSLSNNQNILGMIPQISVYQQSQHIKGHESDCNFTPSPVDSLQRNPLFSSPLSGHYHPPNHHHHHFFGQTQAPERRFRNSVQVASPLNRPESTSSASSFNDWELTTQGQNPALGLRQSLEVRRASGGHFHFPSVQQKIDQALGELSTLGDVSLKQPLYENSRHAMEFSTRLPAGRPVVPIRSVFTDVGYQTTQKIMDRSDPNDKFSVRTEYGKSLLASQANSISSISVGSSTSSTGSGRGRNSDLRLSPASEARLDPGVVKRVPPTGESGSPEMTVPRQPEALPRKQPDNYGRMDKSLESSEILTTVSSVLKQHANQKRDPPVISEVYHERSLGLGLAPPLSKLILSNNLQVVQVDHHSDSDSNEKISPLNSLTATMASVSSKSQESFIFDGDHESFGNFDNLTAIEDAHRQNSFVLANPPSKPLVSHHHPKMRPPVPPKPSNAPLSPDANWYLNTKTALLSPTSPGGNHIHPTNHHLGSFNFHQRDEGDGRSMSDSQYSGCSPSGTNGKVLNTKSMRSLASQMTYMKIGEYLNDQEITVLEEKEVLPKKIAKSFSPVVIESSELKKADFVKRGCSKPSKNDARHLLPVNSSNGDIKHPGQLWSRDRHGGLMYTGKFASDC